MEIFIANTVIYLLANALLIYSYARIYAVYFDRSSLNKRLEFVCFICYYVINSLGYLLYAKPFVNLITNVIPLIGITFIYNGRIRTKLAVPLLCFAFSMLIDNFIWFIFMQLQLDVKRMAGLNSLLCAIIWNFLALAISKRKSPVYDHRIGLLHWLSICFIPIGSIVVIASSFYFIYTKETMLITSPVLIFINVLVFYLFDTQGKYYSDHNEKQLLQQQNRAFQDQFALMRQSEQQVRALRHDMKNHLSVLRHYASEGHIGEMNQYLDAFDEKLFPHREYVNTGNHELDSILNYKLAQAAAASAVISLDISLPEQLNIDIFDLNVVLGNLLDNAAEGVIRSNDKRLSLYLRLDRGVLYIKTTNAYDGVVSIEAADGALRYRTRKKDSTLHGLGLENVKATVEKYHGYLEICDANKLFSVEAVLYTE